MDDEEICPLKEGDTIDQREVGIEESSSSGSIPRADAPRQTPRTSCRHSSSTSIQLAQALPWPFQFDVSMKYGKGMTRHDLTFAGWGSRWLDAGLVPGMITVVTRADMRCQVTH